MNRSNGPFQEHAHSRYMCVTMGVIVKLQQDYFAGRDLRESIPGMDRATAAVIVAESLEADQLWATLPKTLMEDSPLEPRSRPLSDWSLATMAEIFFAVVDEARKQENEEQQHVYWALAWAMLEGVARSPTASPMLWYEDIFFDVGQELRVRGEREAVEFSRRALAHNLYHHEGEGVDSLLRDLAETCLEVDDLDAGLEILTAMLHNDPADIWTYNLMAITFDRFGLTEVGKEAARRGLELIEATGDPEKLRHQLLDALERMRKSARHGREADVGPAVLADLQAALSLAFDAGEHRPVVELCRELVPDLDQVPIKRSPDEPNLPPPDRLAQPTMAPRLDRKPGRNDPCPCGSGRKYKHCCMRTDRGR